MVQLSIRTAFHNIYCFELLLLIFGGELADGTAAEQTQPLFIADYPQILCYLVVCQFSLLTQFIALVENVVRGLVQELTYHLLPYFLDI